MILAKQVAFQYRAAHAFGSIVKKCYMKVSEFANLSLPRHRKSAGQEYLLGID